MFFKYLIFSFLDLNYDFIVWENLFYECMVNLVGRNRKVIFNVKIGRIVVGYFFLVFWVFLKIFRVEWMGGVCCDFYGFCWLVGF